MTTSREQNQPGPQYPQYRFVEFSKVRQLRGAEAARIEIIHSHGDHDELWMSAGDLHANIRQFGKHEALVKALEAYGQGGQG